MKDHWKQIKKSILTNIQGVFENSTSPVFTNIEAGVDLFKNVLYHKTGNKNLDGLAEPLLEALFEIYVSKPGGINQCRSILNNIEPFLKKIIFITTGNDTTTDKSKSLAYCLKELHLLGSQNLDTSTLASYRGQPNFIEHVCRAYIERNALHKAAQITAAEIYLALESALVVYIYAILQNYSAINAVVGSLVTEEVHRDNYRNYALLVLSHNLSHKMLEADFGVNATALADLEVKIKAKTKRRKEERDEYLKDAKYNAVIPFKFLPDIEGVMTNSKLIMLHGIATSGKSTILKKLGKDFIEKYNSPFLFYFELGEIFKKKNGHSIAQEIALKYKEITTLNFEFEKIDEKILILLDGLDEIPIKESRDAIINEIIALKKFNNIQVVITSRTNDYITNDTQIESYFEKFELLPITLNDIISIGEKIIGHGSQFNNFVKMVKKSSLLKAFPKTPLTSILLAILFKEKDINIKELPKNITELYRKFIDLFMNRWDRTKGVSEQFEIQKKEFVLQTIAVHMQKNRLISIPETDLEIFLTDLTSRKQIGGPKDPKEHLRNLCERTCIMMRDEFNGSYKFFHLTIQEYLAAQKFDYKDDDILVENFYDEWWLNPNIFYAGNKNDYPDILKRVAKFESVPIEAETKFNFIAHSSQVLLAAHNLDNDVRNDLLKSMIKVFDEFSKEFVRELVSASDESIANTKLVRARNQTVLDVILSLRDIFMEFFAMTDFKEELDKIWSKIIYSNNKISMCDITLYCLSYCLAIGSKDAKYLEEFVITNNIEINSRWFKIVDVDITIKKLENSRKKISLKIRNVAHKNSEYIQKQFNERIKRHYLSLAGMQ
jgi:thymidylate kinase